MPVTYKPTNVVISPFIRYSGTSAYNPRQALPVIPKGLRAQTISASLKKCSYIWNNVKKLHLTVNMRVVRNGNTHDHIWKYTKNVLYTEILR